MAVKVKLIITARYIMTQNKSSSPRPLPLYSSPTLPETVTFNSLTVSSGIYILYLKYDLKFDLNCASS